MLIRVAYHVYRAVSSTRRWIERRFTPAGLLVLIGLVVTAALGVDVEHAVAYQLYALLAALMSLAMASALFFRGRFEVQRYLSRYGTVGQPLLYRVRVRNRGKRLFRTLELLEDLADPRPTLAEFISTHTSREGARSFRLTKPHRAKPNRIGRIEPIPLPTLPVNGTVELTGRIQPLRRGVLRFSGVTLARSDPFGLFRGFVRVALPDSLVILPKRYLLPPIALPGATRYQQGGVALASSIGESEEFISLREYRPGDPPRRVHWRSWAKTSRLIVKEYQDEFFVRHALVLDTFARPDQSDALEEAISVAASFACAITTQESLLDLMFIGPQAVCFTTGRGLAHTEQALEILASVQPCRDKAFRSLHDLVTQHATALSGCICVLLDWDVARQELIRHIQTLNVPVLTLVIAEAGQVTKIRKKAMEAKEHFHLLEVGRVAEGLAALQPVSIEAA